MASPSMDPTSLDGINLDFRDLPSFLKRIAQDESMPTQAREEAIEAIKGLGHSFIDSYSHGVKQIMKPGTGVSAYMPWKPVNSGIKEGYEQLAWAKESGWSQMLDHVFEGPAIQEAKVQREVKDSTNFSKKASRWAIGAYKKYMAAPYHGRVCSYTDVSCSQYAKQAIEEHGMVEGTKQGFMRMVGCGAGERIADPVPLSNHSHQHVAPQTLPEIRLTPPARVEKSPRRQSVENRLTKLSKSLGRAAGCVTGAVIGAPIGAVMSAVIGWDAGRDKLDERNQRLVEKYGQSKTDQFKNIEIFPARPAIKVRSKITDITGSAWLGRGVGAVVGGVSGAAIGALGGAAKGGQEGGFFTSLLAENLVRDKLGNLPPVYHTERILAADGLGA